MGKVENRARNLCRKLKNSNIFVESTFFLAKKETNDIFDFFFLQQKLLETEVKLLASAFPKHSVVSLVCWLATTNFTLSFSASIQLNLAKVPAVRPHMEKLAPKIISKKGNRHCPRPLSTSKIREKSASIFF